MFLPCPATVAAPGGLAVSWERAVSAIGGTARYPLAAAASTRLPGATLGTEADVTTHAPGDDSGYRGGRSRMRGGGGRLTR